MMYDFLFFALSCGWHECAIEYLTPNMECLYWVEQGREDSPLPCPAPEYASPEVVYED